LRHRFAFRFFSIPGCAGSSVAWPLTGAHRRLCLHASSTLFFKETAVLIHSERRN
jgi:hypothetical protein